MKKSFTLKAFAFGAAAAVALSASATPHELLTKAQLSQSVKPFDKIAKELSTKEANLPIKLSYNVNNQSVAQAPVQKANVNYGAWADAGEGEFTFASMLNNPKGFTYAYQLRTDANNASNFQIQIPTWGKGMFTGTGTNAVFTVENGTSAFAPATGIPTGYDGAISATEKAEVYAYDLYHFYLHLYEIDYTFSDNSKVTDEDLAEIKAMCTYDAATGVLSMPMIYAPSFDLNMGAAAWGQATIETFRRIGPDFKYYNVECDTELAYFSHAKDATEGTYTISYNMNDYAQIVFRMVTGRKTGSALESAFAQMIQDLADAPADIIVSTQREATVSIPVTQYRKGQYTLLVGYSKDGNEYGGFGLNSLRIFDEDLDYYDAGTAEYTDCSMYDALPVVFGATSYDDLISLFISELDIQLPDLDNTYTVTVPLQANSKVEGEYRLVHPYAEYYKNFVSDQLDYDATADYLLFNAADANKCFILPSATGIYFATQSGSEIMMVLGSTNKMQGGNANSTNVWGTYANGEITFPESIIPENATSLEQVTSGISWSQATFSSSSSEVTYKDWSEVSLYPEFCKISAALAGVENVAADAEFDTNAPVEYFNLQGIRVAAPEAGQLLIKRQGKKAEKVVIR